MYFPSMFFQLMKKHSKIHLQYTLLSSPCKPVMRLHNRYGLMRGRGPHIPSFLSMSPLTSGGRCFFLVLALQLFYSIQRGCWVAGRSIEQSPCVHLRS